MKGEDLLKIIGEIDDKYIRECEEYKPRKKINIFAVVRYVAAAASVCLLIASFVLLIRIDNRGERVPNTSTLLSGEFTGPYKEIMYYDGWREDYISEGDLSVEEMGEDGSFEDMASGDLDKYITIVGGNFYWGSKHVNGYVCMTKKLSNMYNAVKSEDILIAVYVGEGTGVSEARVYEEFIKPLNVTEDYMRKRIIYISPKQIPGLTCPKDMKIFFDVVRK